jgi:hypothetical protein
MSKIKTAVKTPSTKFNEQLELKIITDSRNVKNDYEDFTASDFQEGTPDYNGLEIIDLKISGKHNNILTFQVEGYFKDVTKAAINFAVSFDPIDYTLSDLERVS